MVHFLKRNPKNNTSKAHTKEVPESKKASLDYTVFKKLDNYYALEIDLHTGRHHQIRAQLTAVGCPIKGDLKYGFDRSNPNGGIHLHARKLVLTHPVTKDPLETVLLQSARLQFGGFAGDVQATHAVEAAVIEQSTYPFFIANMASMLPNPVKRPLSKLAFAKFEYRCPAYNLALLWENKHLCVPLHK